MERLDKFFSAIGIRPDDHSAIKELSVKSGVPTAILKYYNEANIIPSGKDLRCILYAVGVSEIELMLRMGSLNRRLTAAIERHSNDIYRIIKADLGERYTSEANEPKVVLETSLGRLYQGDCLDLMRSMDDDSVDLIFADPPFNLNKIYASGINDNLKREHYLAWCEEWIGECIRILKFGGSFFVWNLPKWSTYLAGYLNRHLTFRHWIAVDIKYRLPIASRLYPSHYSLLYYCKGPKPKTFHPDRLPMLVCPSCKADLIDYGGYKDKMNPKGVNLTDVWFDIPPVRHAKYKKRKGANELSIKLMDRIIEMASNEGDLVFDPFGGSGTTYVVSEINRRKWVGIEIGPGDDIIRRFKTIQEDETYLNEIRQKLNCLFTEETLKARLEKGLWTCETFQEYKNKSDNSNQLEIQF